jgi:hypothetical protein
VHIKGLTNDAVASPDVAKQYGLPFYGTFAAANEDRKSPGSKAGTHLLPGRKK